MHFQSLCVYMCTHKDHTPFYICARAATHNAETVQDVKHMEVIVI